VGAGLVLVALRAGDYAILLELHVAGGIRLGVLCLRRVAPQVGFSLPQLRGVLLQRGFGLPQRLLVGARIDLEQQIALVDVLALDKVHGEQLAGDLRFDLHDRGRLHSTDGVNLHRSSLLRRSRNADRDRWRPAGRGLSLLRAAAGEQRQGADGEDGKVKAQLYSSPTTGSITRSVR